MEPATVILGEFPLSSKEEEKWKIANKTFEASELAQTTNMHHLMFCIWGYILLAGPSEILQKGNKRV